VKGFVEAMKTPYIFIPSELAAGETEFLRQHGFTKWMSADLLQMATDFLKKLGLMPVYAEYSSDKKHRYLLWQAPANFACEVRSGRTVEQFIGYDNGNIDRGWKLLSLQINPDGFYSAVWVPDEHVKAAQRFLNGYGITPASRMLKT